MNQAWQTDELGRFFEMSVDLIGTAGFDGHFKRVGQAWERTLGFSREELLSTPFIDFVHPDDRERTLAESAQVFGGSGSVTFTNRYRCRDGSYRWIEWNSSVHPEEELVYFVARDITDRKRAEESLLEAESRFRAAVEGSLDAFFVLRSVFDEAGTLVDFVLTDANQRALTGISMPREEIVGKRLSDLSPAARQQLDKYARVARTGERLLEEEQSEGPVHKDVWFQHQVIPLSDGVAITIRDITPFKQLEAELREALHRRAIHAEELEEKNRLLAAENAERERAEALMRQQQETMRAMSTPIIQAWEGVLVLPIIGTVETGRANDIMERLLTEIVRTSARFAILDLTGVSAVDAATVAHLLAVVRAANLLGSSCLVSGISPEIARTMTELGAADGGFKTFGVLQSALRYALSRCGAEGAR
ncbi:anti-anti sigma factor protein [Sorangium cellulosum So ce56]|uniref:Anti-anti sigma factor protein n=1 Tax=Sorangium cellulosum (strain So ce56) TaxID=448385 RepID=A9GLX0_SORC5|nr:PAS domain S-box protein [Sorangium cellulosum]CAN90339.1 anti-anti sigma factor protein [Sorangium cellulosum So ce56]